MYAYSTQKKQNENAIEWNNIVVENSRVFKKMKLIFLCNCFYCTEQSLFKCLYQHTSVHLLSQLSIIKKKQNTSDEDCRR